MIEGVKMHQQVSRRLRILVDRHQRLDDEVDELSERKILLPAEKQHLKELKITRLRAKEAIDRFLNQERKADLDE